MHIQQNSTPTITIVGAEYILKEVDKIIAAATI